MFFTKLWDSQAIYSAVSVISQIAVKQQIGLWVLPSLQWKNLLIIWMFLSLSPSNLIYRWVYHMLFLDVSIDWTNYQSRPFVHDLDPMISWWASVAWLDIALNCQMKQSSGTMMLDCFNRSLSVFGNLQSRCHDTISEGHNVSNNSTYCRTAKM